MHRTGTAGWSLPIKPNEPGSHLHHYSRTLGCVEVNSSFYRPHRASTWARWARETPADFRFSIKAPRTITHEAKLGNPEGLLKAFLEQIEPLQEKAGPILFQLPPSLAFDAGPAAEFLACLRMSYGGDAVLEPRHETWFTADVDDLLKKYNITRVAADPPKGSPEQRSRVARCTSSTIVSMALRAPITRTMKIHSSPVWPRKSRRCKMPGSSSITLRYPMPIRTRSVFKNSFKEK